MKKKIIGSGFFADNTNLISDCIPDITKTEYYNNNLIIINCFKKITTNPLCPKRESTSHVLTLLCAPCHTTQGCCLRNFKGALRAKSWELRSPTYEVKDVAMKNSGAQSYSLGVPGYRAPVRQQPCHLWTWHCSWKSCIVQATFSLFTNLRTDHE